MIEADNQQERLGDQWYNRFMEWLENVPENIGWYIAGFSDGEGSFNVSFRKGNGHRLGWQVQLTFNVSQRDISNLELMQCHLGCGRLQHRKDGVHYFVVSDFHSIINRVIPFFSRFTFFSLSKKKNFSLFQDIVLLVHQRKHLDSEGLHKIIAIREKLNEGRGRKRKYNAKDIILITRESSETTRQTRP